MAMIKKMNPFILPKRSNPQDLEEEYDHKIFKQWISDLPIGKVGQTARALHHELKRHNILDMSPIERFEAVELMLPALGFVREGLWSHYSTKPFPLSQENSLIARLHLEILVSVVVAYKTVMSQFHDESFTGHLLHKHTRVEAVRRALYFLSEILLHEYSIYRASPKFAWREMHGIYHYAAINDLKHKEIEDVDDDPIGIMNIDDIYKRILLIALTYPNGLLRGEITRVKDALIDWLPEVSIVPLDKEITSSSVFVVDATKDGPAYVVDVAEIGQIKYGWLLLADRLDAILESEISEIRGRSKGKLRPIELVTATLFEKLRKRWVPDAVLREERAKGSGVIEVVSGLESLHWLFGGWKLEQEVESDLDSTAELESGEDKAKLYEKPVRALEQDEFIIDADPDLIAAIESKTESSEGEVGVNLATQEEIEVDFYNSVMDGETRGEECACLNESKKGYYLTWSGGGEYKAHVGELIGVNSRDNLDFDGSWSLGIIRWMQVQDKEVMGFGIEKFEGEIESIRLDSRRGNDSNAIIGFQQKINGKVETLITRPFFFNENDKLLLTTAEGQFPIVPGEIVECTDVCMRFKLHFDSSAVDESKPGSIKRSEAEDIFSSIWNDL